MQNKIEIFDAIKEENSKLVQTVLSWEVWSLQNLVLPEAENISIDPSRVPVTFDSTKAHFDYFNPLLMEECRASMEAEIQDRTLAPVRGKIRTQPQTPDDWILDFEMKPGIQDPKALPVTNDYVLLTPAFPASKSELSGNFRFERPETRYGIGVVCASSSLPAEQDPGKKADPKELKIAKVRIRRNGTRFLGLVPAFFYDADEIVEWDLYKLSNLTTALREREALITLRDTPTPLHNFLLNPSPASPGVKLSSHIRSCVEATSSYHKLNISQKEALFAVLRSDTPVTLVQGPPGTGKTSTLIALLSALFASSGTQTKILVCAPSNAATDLLVSRVLKNGLTKMVNGTMQPYWPKFCRTGRYEKITKEEVMELHLEHYQLPRRDRLTHLKRFPPRSTSPEEEPELEMGRYAWMSVRGMTFYGVINEASIVFSTLSGAGSRLIREHAFDVAIVDEATQATEPSTLIALGATYLNDDDENDDKNACENRSIKKPRGARKLILFGDQNQLPATVISMLSTSRGYNRSLFERLHMAGVPTHMLEVQYRMRPEISRYPTRKFYQGRVEDDPTLVVNRPRRSFHAAAHMFSPFRFFHVEGVDKMSTITMSRYNELEANVVAGLVSLLLRTYLDIRPADIGVITPYQEQATKIRLCLNRIIQTQPPLDVFTVDSFQGQERAVIIFSAVRSTGPGIGFVKDPRRLNVAITRARDALWLVGNAFHLALYSPAWSGLLDAARESRAFHEDEQPTSTLTYVQQGRRGTPEPQEDHIKDGWWSGLDPQVAPFFRDSHCAAAPTGGGGRTE